MRKGVSLWLIVLSLVFTRLVGLHLHACAGLESGTAHAGTHYADNGFLFGDFHVEDDGDDTEMEIVTLATPSVHFDLGDLTAAIPASPVLVTTATRLLTVIAPRGPPASLPSHPPHFAPPLRGPPSHSLA